MKFRTDFVTNSSDSSFVAFNIKNKKLFDALTALGIKIEGAEDGKFGDKMTIVLPSGRRASIESQNTFCDEEVDSYHDYSDDFADTHGFLSDWLKTVFFEAGTQEDFNGTNKDIHDETYKNFNDELIGIISKAFSSDHGWKAVDALSGIVQAMTERFGDDTEVLVEQGDGFEGEGWLSAAKIKNGKRMHLEYKNDEELETEDCDGLTFVVTGKLRYFENREEIVEYIEEMGGEVSDSVSKNTDYLICNDISSNSSKMKKATELGITVLTEAAFIRRFGDPEGFEDIQSEDDLYDEFWEYTGSSGGMDFMIENGLSPIYMEVWKDGKWVSAKPVNK